MTHSDQRIGTNEPNDTECTEVASLENQKRRDALRKLGKYGKVSAVVTTIVYSGLNSQEVVAMSPPPPPPDPP